MNSTLLRFLLRPYVAGTLAATVFALGFLLGLYNVGYWDPIYYTVNYHRPSEERLRMQLDQNRKLAMELDSWGKAQKKRTEDLNEREARLREAENNLKTEKAALENMLKEIRSLRAQLDNRMLTIGSAQESNIKQQVRRFNAMTVDSAAALLISQSDVQAVQILRRMKEEKSAKILEFWAKRGGEAAEKAARVMERLQSAIDTAAEEGAR
ncbi:MAG: hypothetical protein HY360_01720 [Verrucomicrobia bacterium]|nr:hypothetical protein [Verrucomicrobiota bacterium]